MLNILQLFAQFKIMSYLCRRIKSQTKHLNYEEIYFSNSMHGRHSDDDKLWTYNVHSEQTVWLSTELPAHLYGSQFVSSDALP